MMEKQFFRYGDAELEHLKAKDSALGKTIAEIGLIEREIIPDLFAALVNSIIGQQISTKAFETVWRRFCDSFTPITAAHIAEIPAVELQTCGISMRKATYIREAADSVVCGDLDLNALHTATDNEVIERLCRLRGIGVWTAEMLMIFSMQRADVLSFGDMAILRGLRMLYRHRKITPQLFAKYKRRYSPYASVASLYLWAIAGGACEGLYDPAPKQRSKNMK